MSTQKYPMTVLGYQTLKQELTRLKSEERPKIINAIATARALGDLKENAEYHAAREQQSFTEGRIIELEAKLAHAQVIDVKKIPNQGKVIFGSTVKLLNLQNDMEMTYQIVGEDEVDLKANKISSRSPLGQALIAKSVEDTVTVQAPNGAVEYEILEVNYI